jgi:hypothetical protein
MMIAKIAAVSVASWYQLEADGLRAEYPIALQGQEGQRALLLPLTPSKV